MAMMERPSVTVMADGGKFWEHEFEKFYLKVFVPKTEIDGEVVNYSFRAPLLLVFEENRKPMEEAVEFAKTSGLAEIASSVDSSVLFVYPTCEGGWKNADTDLYVSLISEIKMNPYYKDGIIEITDFFTKEFKGFFVKGAIFRADIYSYGASADYVAKNLIKTIQGEYLWGPGEITPACLSMEKLSVMPEVERKDIAIISVGNPAEINNAFLKPKNLEKGPDFESDGCCNLLIKDEADYKADYKSFVRQFKMWCGKIEFEPDFEALKMTEAPGFTLVQTSSDNRGRYKDAKEHKVGYFAYYNNDAFDKGPVPLMIGFHGGGDSSMYLTFVAGWWEVCHKYGFLYVAIENHQDVTATEVVEVINDLKKKYNIDEHRIYCSGFSMGSGKTWDMYQEYPEIFAGMAPQCALFPVRNNPFGKDLGDKLNTTVSVPLFYAGGEKSHLPELPFQAESGMERIQYAADVQKLKKKFDVSYLDKENWADKIWGVPGDKVEKIHDDSRDANLTINYYESEDGVIRTAFASVDNQVHECRRHTNEQAWKFISQFTNEGKRTNPIMKDLYTADPAPFVYNDTLYLYTTHDEDILKNNFYTMYDWRCYSTKNMINWTDHGKIFSLDDIEWADDRAWAPQAIERNGKFYLYCPVHKKDGGMAIAVGVSDSPTGPFKDLGYPLVDEGDWNDIDPTVFIDDDGQAYLYFGNPELRYVLLNEDMISYDKEVGVGKIPMTVESFGKGGHMTGTTYGEGPWFYKRNNIYYMVYAAFGEGKGRNEHFAYSTSSGPLGPWKYQGILMEEGKCFTNHPGICDFKGHSYLFYHTDELTGGSLFHRSVCVAEFRYNEDGTIDTIDKCGGVSVV